MASLGFNLGFVYLKKLNYNNYFLLQGLIVWEMFSSKETFSQSFTTRWLNDTPLTGFNTLETRTFHRYSTVYANGLPHSVRTFPFAIYSFKEGFEYTLYTQLLKLIRLVFDGMTDEGKRDCTWDSSPQLLMGTRETEPEFRLNKNTIFSRTVVKSDKRFVSIRDLAFRSFRTCFRRWFRMQRPS
jgi:hypothetical protein